ncbi:MAG TPA: class I SAM-dependent methyltransferase, partial [Anaerolineae bacterium]|nr:class I SAM-dependent methyltransferase [Anaerolineae bacterium]
HYMPKLLMQHYSSRVERAQFIAMNFKPYLIGRVLDVGCAEAFLKKHINQYIGLDITGNPDLLVNLEQTGLPFCDKAFDTVMCIDVLEHLDSLTKVLRDLFRVASQYVIISLPNVYALGWRLKFLRGQVLSKEYSLLPRNRHKWLPSFTETRIFMRTQLPQNWYIKWEFGYYPPAWWRVGPLYKTLALAHPNLLATTYWALFEHRPS